MSSYSYWIATGDVADFKAKLGLAGFVEEDGKWYFDADPERKFYLKITVDAAIYGVGCVNSAGTPRNEILVNGNNSPCYFEFHELANGGVAIKMSKTSNVTSPINTISMINFAVLPKKTGDGFVYLFKDGTSIFLDTNDGICNAINTASLTQGVGQANATIVHITSAEDGRGGFIDADVYTALNLTPAQLYTQSFLFDIGEDTYLAGMGTNGSGSGMGNRLIFKLAK